MLLLKVILANCQTSIVAEIFTSIPPEPDVRAPSFTNKTNLNGNVKELAERQSWALICDSVGLPKPTVTWFKVGEF